jgi:hypothetical protein
MRGVGGNKRLSLGSPVDADSGSWLSVELNEKRGQKYPLPAV